MTNAKRAGVHVLSALATNQQEHAAEAVKQRGQLMTNTDLPAASLARAIALPFATRPERSRETCQEHKAWLRNAHAIALQLTFGLVITEIYATHAIPKEDAG